MDLGFGAHVLQASIAGDPCGPLGMMLTVMFSWRKGEGETTKKYGESRILIEMVNRVFDTQNPVQTLESNLMH